MQLIRLPETLTKTGLTRTRLYAAIDAGTFPKPVKITARAVAWPTDEVDAWISARIAERETVAAA
jgi:prophage regulatory protein